LFDEPAQDLSVLRVAELLHGVADGQPQQLVHLISGDEFATGAGRRPVVHLFDALVDRIRDDGEAPTQIAVVSGLFEYLADGGDRRGLARVDFAFG
jgi:hypothetical protein